VVGLALRLERGAFSSGMRLGYGRGDESFESWSYGLDSLVTELHAGYGWDLGALRLTIGAGVSVGRLWQVFDDETSRTAWMFYPAGRLGLMLPTRAGLSFELTLDAGTARLAGAGRATGYHWLPRGGVGLAVYYQL
jgi:hypothetical protein